MKRKFHLVRARYFGTAKVQAQMCWAALGMNLLKTHRKLKSCNDRCPKAQVRPLEPQAARESAKGGENGEDRPENCSETRQIRPKIAKHRRLTRLCSGLIRGRRPPPAGWGNRGHCRRPPPGCGTAMAGTEPVRSRPTGCGARGLRVPPAEHRQPLPQRCWAVERWPRNPDCGPPKPPGCGLDESPH